MGWDYVCEIRPSTVVLFIAQVIHEHGELWWNEFDREYYLICQPELSENSTSSHLVANRGNGRRE
jgi:hypothetical protein